MKVDLMITLEDNVYTVPPNYKTLTSNRIVNVYMDKEELKIDQDYKMLGPRTVHILRDTTHKPRISAKIKDTRIPINV